MDVRVDECSGACDCVLVFVRARGTQGVGGCGYGVCKRPCSWMWGSCGCGPAPCRPNAFP